MSTIQKILRMITNPLELISYLTGINFCYSQTGEDLIFKHIIHKDRWFYIDIGANHPIHYNNTYMLYKKWRRGINIEPNKSLIKKFKLLRRWDRNLQFACGSGEKLTFYHFSPSTLSTCDKKLVTKYQEMWHTLIDTYNVPVITLKSIFEEYVPMWKDVDILSIDVEWYDLEVLKTNDRTMYRPHYVVLETIEYSTDGGWKKLNPIYDPLFMQWWYEKIADTYINTIYRKI